MELFDVIIVGSGPSAVSALKALKDKKVLILDVGMVTNDSGDSLNKSLRNLKKGNEIKFSDVIGDKFESLNNIHQEYMSPKIKAPLMRFVSNKFNELNKFKTTNFFVLGSFAKGGLSNAWGGGSMRYTEEDLKDFPLSYSQLEKHYDYLTNEIGISGENDDLKVEFLEDKNLLPPPELNFLAIDLLTQYKRLKAKFIELKFSIGFPRSAFITAAKGSREVYKYDSMEFFKPYTNSIYNAKLFLENIVKEKSNVTYLDKKMVVSFVETDGSVEVKTIDITSGDEVNFTAQKLIIGAGCIGTSKIVLKSFNDFEAELPMLDNLVTYIPFVNFKFIGKKEDQRIIPPQLILMAEDERNKYLCSMYKLNNTLSGDYLMDFPLSVKGNIKAVKYLVPSILIMQVFYPDYQKKKNYLKLLNDGSVEIKYEDEEPRGNIEKKIIANFRRLGLHSMSFLVKKLRPGNSFHYSGTLPMKEKPGKFQTDSECRLFGTKNVFIVDGSVFPVLPAKNNTFTIMANAMRVGELVGKSL